MPRRNRAAALLAALLALCAQSAAQQKSGGHWEINGTRLHYVTIGTGAPVVVLHGGPGGNLTSKLDLVSFAPSHRWVFYDQRGCGESDRLPVDLDHLDEAAALFSIERQVEDLDQVRARLGADKITLLGHSWGGALAVFYAAAHPDRLTRLIVYNGGPMWPELRAAKKAALKARSAPEINQRIGELVAGISDSISTWEQDTLDARFVGMIRLLIPAYGCLSPEPPPSIEMGRGGFWANQFTNRYIKTLDRGALARRLAQVTAPTLITYGRCEPNPPERQTYLRDALPNSAMVVFDRSGHTPHVEQRELFGQVLRAFLADQPLPLEPYHGQASDLGWSATRTCCDGAAGD